MASGHRCGLSFVFTLCLCFGGGYAQEAAPPSRLLLKNGLVTTGPNWVGEAVSVLIEGDRIQSIGLDLPEGDGVQVIDLKGAHLAPAWIDARTTELFDGGIAATAMSGVDGMARDALALLDATTKRRLQAAGIALAYADPLPREGSALGGIGAIVRLDPVAFEVEVLEHTAGVSASLAAAAGGSGERTVTTPDGRTFRVPMQGGRRQVNRDPMTHRQAIQAIEAAFGRAERYKTAREKFEKDLAEFEKKLAEWKKGSAPAEKAGEGEKPAAETPTGGPPKMPEGFREWSREKRAEWMRENVFRRPNAGAEPQKSAGAKGGARPNPPTEPRREPAMEALLAVLDRKAPLRCEAHWREEIEGLLDLATRRKIRLVLVGGTEAWRLSERLKALEVPVILGLPHAYLGANDALAGDAVPDLAKRLAEAGVTIAFGSAESQGFRASDLGLIAALSVGEGLSEAHAQTALTSGAAQALGLTSRGAIAVGQIADLQVTSGAPLDPNSRPLAMIVKGDWRPTDSGERR